jgi:cytosine/adenosine deaminase-related metal-dependent hydrolase
MIFEKIQIISHSSLQIINLSVPGDRDQELHGEKTVDCSGYLLLPGFINTGFQFSKTLRKNLGLTAVCTFDY